MKRVLFILVMLWGVAYGQSTVYIRGDSIRMQKVGGNTSLILENATRTVTGGVLTNVGNGRTAFVLPTTSRLSDSVFGSIYTAGTWASLTGFTNGSTAAVSSGNIAFSGGGGGPNNFNQYLSYDYVTGLERWSQFYSIIVTEKSDTSYGLSIGVKSVNSSGGAYLVNNQVKLDLTNGSNSGRLSLWQNTTKLDSSSTTLPFDVGDTVWVLVERELNDYSIIAFNKTTNSAQVRFNYSVIGTVGTHNTGKFTVWANGGDFTIDSINIFSKQVMNPQIAILCDSKANTYGLTDYDQRYPARLNAYYGSTINNGGNGDKTNESLQHLHELLRMKPKIVWLSIGHNDVATGVNIDTIKKNIDTITQRLQRIGARVIHTSWYTPITDQSALNAWLLDTYPDEFIDGFTPLQECSECFASDNVHLSAIGHEKAFQQGLFSGLLEADRNLLSKNDINATGLPKTLKEGGNSYGRNFVAGSNDDYDFSLRRNSTKLFELSEWGGNVPLLYMPQMSVGINPLRGKANGVTMEATNYASTTAFNIAWSGADSLAANGLRGLNANLFGTGDNNLFMLPAGVYSRVGGYSIFSSVNTSGLYLNTINTDGQGNMPIRFAVNSVFKGEVNPSYWSYETPQRLKDISTPSTPASGYGYLYTNTDSIWFINDAGVNVNLMRAAGGGGSQTFQQTLITGSTLTQDNTIDGKQYKFLLDSLGDESGLRLIEVGTAEHFIGFNTVEPSIKTITSSLVTEVKAGNSELLLDAYDPGNGSYASDIILNKDSISIRPSNGILNIDSLARITDSTGYDIVARNRNTGQVKKIYAGLMAGSGGSGSPAGNTHNIQFNRGGSFTGTDSLNWVSSQLRLLSTTGVAINPGSDAAADLVTVNVTGTPKLAWNETSDIFTLNKGLKATGAVEANITSGSNFTNTISGSQFVTVFAHNSVNPGVFWAYNTDLRLGVAAGSDASGIVEWWRISDAGKLSNTGSDGTSWLTLKAGSATANTAPIGFTSGATESTIRSGLMQYNNQFYLSNNALNQLGVEGVIAASSDLVSNSGTSATTLVTYTTKANTLAATNEQINGTIRGSFGDATGTETMEMTFAGTTILSIAPAGNDRAWKITYEIVRTGASTATAFVDFSSPLDIFHTTTFLTGLTFSNTNALVLTGTSSQATTDAIVKEYHRMRFGPPANN